MATTTPNYDDLWRSIAQAGGIDAYVTQQLKERGFLTERSDASQMSKNELKRYKASLKAEAAEKLRLKKEAWLAYRSQHIVHLGEGMYWNDAADIDGFDLAEPEARASENELPQLDNPKQLADALSLTVAAVLFCGFVILLLWDGYRLAAVGALTLLFLVGGWFLLKVAQRRLGAESNLFSVSLAELERDRDSFTAAPVPHEPK